MSNKNLDINQSPTSMSKGGRFASKKPYIILIGIIILFLIGMIYATAQRGNSQNQQNRNNPNAIKSDTTKIDELLNALSSVKREYLEVNKSSPKVITITKTLPLYKLQKKLN
jgi:flagellar basal body-associated protein FliL